MGVWLLIVLLAVCALALSAKLFLLRRDLHVLAADLHDHLHTDSNTLLTSDSRDPALRAIAATLNDELAELRRQRLRLPNVSAGDRVRILLIRTPQRRLPRCFPLRRKALANRPYRLHQPLRRRPVRRARTDHRRMERPLQRG